MPKVKIVGLPRVKILDLPKAKLGLNTDTTTTLNLIVSTTTTISTTIEEQRDINGCIIGKEQWSVADNMCMPIDGGYDSKQDEEKNKPAVPVTNSSGEEVGGPASNGSTTTTTISTNVYVPGVCPKHWHKDKNGNCVPDKRGINTVKIGRAHV